MAQRLLGGSVLGPEVLPSAPPLVFANKSELRAHYTAVAHRTHTERVAPTVPMTASCHKIGTTFGVGVGLYFEVISWFKWVFLVLSLFSIPFWVAINTSVFTDTLHKYDRSFGVKVYESMSIFSFSFAAIADYSLDNNTLLFMNTDIAGQWNGPMRKSTFLTWIACVDAFGILLFVIFTIFATMRYRRVIRSVGNGSVEAADFTVLVKGLPPDAEAPEIGSYFSRFGDVMDVVIIKEMDVVLGACTQASRLEEKRRTLQDKLRMGNSAKYVEANEKTIAELEKVMGRIEKRMEKSKFPLRAAFVTFNTVQEQKACIDNCPNGWFSKWFQRRADRFRGKNAFWAERACPPEDYMYENIACNRTTRFMRVIFTRLVVLGILLLCAACVTKLCNLSTQESRVITWKSESMKSAIAASFPSAALSTLLNKLLSFLPPPHNNHAPTASMADEVAFCTDMLSGTCSLYYTSLFDASLKLEYGSQVQWSSTLAGLLYQRPLLVAMEACAGNLNATCTPVASCYPCLCSGLSFKESFNSGDPQWMTNTRTTCGVYIDSYNLRSWGIRIGIALVIAFVNQALKLVLEWLLLFERHWTLSSQEMAYAWIAFLAQLINSVVILLLVNAADVNDDSISGMGAVVVVGDHNRPAWISSFILNGSYNDFTRAWYENVGLPIIILLMINVLQPIGSLFADLAWKWSQRWFTVHCMDTAGQGQYNVAFAPPSFDLQNRVADAMLNLSIAVVFASGMPLCYLIGMVIFVVKDVVERFALTRVCRAVSRYGTDLSALIIALLPWVALGHCILGLWMHTHFKIDRDDAIERALSSNALLHATWDHLSRTSIFARITQSNGLPLLFAGIIIALWLLLKLLIWPLVRPLVKLCLLHTPQCCLRKASIHHPNSLPGPEIRPTYQEAVSGRPRALVGIPTYRLPHHPRYANAFMGQLYRAIMAKAVGGARFTRLTSGMDDTFYVAPVIYLEADVAALEHTVLHMPTSKLSEVVRRMARGAVVSSVAVRQSSSTAHQPQVQVSPSDIELGKLGGGTSSSGGPRTSSGGGLSDAASSVSFMAAVARAAGAGAEVAVSIAVAIAGGRRSEGNEGEMGQDATKNSNACFASEAPSAPEAAKPSAPTYPACTTTATAPAPQQHHQHYQHGSSSSSW